MSTGAQAAGEPRSPEHFGEVGDFPISAPLRETQGTSRPCLSLGSGGDAAHSARPDLPKGDILTLARMKHERVRRLRAYGSAAGLEVLLLAEIDTETVAPLRVAVMGAALATAEPLAVFPNSDDGRAGADTLAAAVLRALELAHPSDEPGAAA